MYSIQVSEETFGACISGVKAFNTLTLLAKHPTFTSNALYIIDREELRLREHVIFLYELKLGSLEGERFIVMQCMLPVLELASIVC